MPVGDFVKAGDSRSVKSFASVSSVLSRVPHQPDSNPPTMRIPVSNTCTSPSMSKCRLSAIQRTPSSTSVSRPIRWSVSSASTMVRPIGGPFGKKNASPAPLTGLIWSAPKQRSLYAAHAHAICARTSSPSAFHLSVAPSAGVSAVAARPPSTTRRSNPSRTDQLEEFREIDIAAGDDGDDRPFAGIAAQCGRQRQRAGAFGDHARLLRHQPHRVARLIEADNEIAIDQRLHPFPHAREDTLAARAIDESVSPFLEFLRRTHPVRQ